MPNNKQCCTIKNDNIENMQEKILLYQMICKAMDNNNAINIIDEKDMHDDKLKK